MERTGWTKQHMHFGDVFERIWFREPRNGGESGNGPGNKRSNATAHWEMFGVNCIKFREAGNSGESGKGVETTG